MTKPCRQTDLVYKLFKILSSSVSEINLPDESNHKNLSRRKPGIKIWLIILFFLTVFRVLAWWLIQVLHFRAVRSLTGNILHRHSVTDGTHCPCMDLCDRIVMDYTTIRDTFGKKGKSANSLPAPMRKLYRLAFDFFLASVMADLYCLVARNPADFPIGSYLFIFYDAQEFGAARLSRRYLNKIMRVYALMSLFKVGRGKHAGQWRERIETLKNVRMDMRNTA